MASAASGCFFLKASTSHTSCFGSKCLLGNRPSWNLWLYSTYFTPMNVKAQAIVTRMLILTSFCCPSCAARTAQAAVRLLRMSTTVFSAPMLVSR